MKKLTLFLMMLASLVFAADIAFTPFAKVAKDLHIEPDESFGASEYLDFPAMPKKAGMTAVLKLNQRIYCKTFGGWNRGACTIEINGKELNQNTKDGRARLLFRSRGWEAEKERGDRCRKRDEYISVRFQSNHP